MYSFPSQTCKKSQMDEVQEIRDRKICGTRSSRRSNDEIRKIERAKSIIRDLEQHGPAGLIHVSVLSNIIGKSIKIWNADTGLNSIIGKGPAINIEYHANKVGGIGHWTLIQAKDPDNVDIDLNSCLFSVIGSQTGLNPSELRKWTLLRLKGNLRQLANQLDEILLKGSNNESAVMIGGARLYKGMSPCDAKLILDKSQGAKPCSSEFPGHPRGHAVAPEETGSRDSVENYSRIKNEKGKTAFLSRSDQDSLAHLVLSTDNAKAKIEELNMNNLDSITLKISPNEIREEFIRKGRIREDDYTSIHIPKIRTYRHGSPVGQDQEIKTLVMVLRHHKIGNGDDGCDRREDVFIHTFYPVAR